jgi:hypothetical protein
MTRLVRAGLILAALSWTGCQKSAHRPAPASGVAPAGGRADSALAAGNPDSPARVADVVRAYYRAIEERRYHDAWRLWASDGAASGKSFRAFQAGFANTAAVEAVMGTPGPMGGAAGSRYIEVPVRVIARQRDGTSRTYQGTYTLRRSVVDGATPEQQTWHLYTASLRLVP